MRSFLRHPVLAVTLLLTLPVWGACGSDGGGDGGTDPTPGIAISVSPGTLVLERGEDGLLTVTLVRSGGFAGAVQLAVDGLPAGVGVQIQQIPAGGSQGRITLSAGAQATAGTATLTIRANGSDALAGAVVSATATVGLTVEEVPVGTFQLSLDPASLSIEQGQGASTTVTVDRSGGFAGTVNLVVSGAPAGLTAALASAAVDGTETTLQVDVGGAVAAASYTLTLTGSGDGTADASVQLPVTVTEAPGGGPTRATWTFCADVPIWFAVQDGPSGAWTRVQPAGGSGGTRFELNVDSDRVGVAYVMDVGFLPGNNTTLDVNYLGADELPLVGSSFCQEAGPKTVNVTVQPIAVDEIASLALGPSLATIFGAVSPTGTFQEVVDGTVDLFGARSQLDQGTGAQTVNRYYLERGLEPAQGSTVPVDFAGPNSFDPVQATATIGNLGADPATLSVGFTTPTTANFLGVASLGMPSNDPTRGVPLVPAGRQVGGDLHSVFVTAVDDTNDPEFFRTGIVFFGGVEDPVVDLGPRVQGQTLSIGSTVPYVRPRVQYPIQPAYDRFWAASFDQGNRTVELLVTDGWATGSTLDVTFPDLSAAAGWNPGWALQVGAATEAIFTALGWSAGEGTIVPMQLVDGLRILSAAWGGPFIP